MGVPASTEARLFYRCAGQRYEESKILRKAEHRTGAIYLAGYSVECMLKAMILQSVPRSRQRQVLESFRGNRGHDFEWLRAYYLREGGAHFPTTVTRSFALVNDWSTEMRYLPRVIRPSEADAFLRATDSIISWADGRL